MSVHPEPMASVIPPAEVVCRKADDVAFLAADAAKSGRPVDGRETWAVVRDRGAASAALRGGASRPRPTSMSATPTSDAARNTPNSRRAGGGVRSRGSPLSESSTVICLVPSAVPDLVRKHSETRTISGARRSGVAESRIPKRGGSGYGGCARIGRASYRGGLTPAGAMPAS
jgi:hypothetical protein